MRVFLMVIICLFSSVVCTIFRPMYGKLVPPFGNPLMSRGIPGRHLRRSPIRRLPPLVPPFPIKVLWKKKMDPRTGKLVKVMHRKPFTPIDLNHFARKAHFARKMHKMSKTQFGGTINTIRGGVLGRQRLVRGYPLRYPTQRKITRPHFTRHHERIIPINTRPNRFANIGHRDSTRRQHSYNPLPRPQRLNRHLYDEIDNSFDDRFDDGFGPAFLPIQNRATSHQINTRLPPARHNDIQTTHMGFRGEVDRRGPMFPMVSPAVGITGSASIGGFERDIDHRSDDMLKHGARERILDSFDRQMIPGDRFNSQNTGTFNAQQNIQHEVNARFTPSTTHSFPNTNPHHGFINEQFDIDSAFGDTHDSDGFMDDVEDITDGISDVHDRMEDKMNLVKNPLDFIYEQFDLSSHVDTITDLQVEATEHMKETFEDIHDDNDSLFGNVADTIADTMSEGNTLRGIGGTVVTDIDDGIAGDDDGPIHGLQLLGPSSWQDVLTEIQTVGTQYDPLQMLQDNIQVLPVNPHAREEIIPTGIDVINHDMDFISDIDTGINDVGSFALLGIDPTSLVASEISVDANTRAPEHPPPVPIPNSVQDSLKMNNTDTSVTESTVASVSATSSKSKTATELALDNALDTLTTLTVLNAMTYLDIAS